jgi:DNA-binding response OmpR family regulator
MITLNECRILCVDDNEDARFMLSTLFRQEGYTVATAGSIEEALPLARSEQFDLYVLDKLFPDGDGTDLCRELRGQNPQALVVIYSGAAYDEDKRAGFGVGAEAYVTKPNVEGLVAVVNDLLKGKALPHD